MVFDSKAQPMVLIHRRGIFAYHWGCTYINVQKKFVDLKSNVSSLPVFIEFICTENYF